MIAQEFEYTSPATLKEALELLGSGAKPLAGGMSLIPMMKLRLAAPDHLVDLARIPSLNGIHEANGRIHIGAMTTHYQVEASPLIRSKCPLLAETASNIGDVQVRNMGTIGGSTAHADPASDYPAALLALEATFKLAGAGGEREVSAAGFFLDTFTTALEPGEIVVEISVPTEDSGTGTAYQKMSQPASGFAIVGVAARVHKTNGKIDLVRVGVTGVGPHPYRAANIEGLLTGTAGSDDDIRKAVAGTTEGIEVNSDLHASADYRAHMAAIYAARALRSAISRAL